MHSYKRGTIDTHPKHLSKPARWLRKFISELPGQQDCILWPFGKNTGGYGMARWNGRKTAVSRIVYEQCVGPLGNLDVLHRCDTPACINPNHLFAGTAHDNMIDMLEKNRRETKVGKADVLRIRQLASDGMSHIAIASECGLSRGHVSRIIRQERWHHVAA